MADETNNWKLGLFALLTAGAVGAALIYLGASNRASGKTEWVTFVDESVQGLETESPVKVRGAPIGRVVGIGMAPDHKTVRVTFQVDLERLVELGLEDVPEVGPGEIIKGDSSRVPEGARVQLASAGITGIKYLELNFFDPEAHPVPEYDFELPSNFIPSTPSTLASIGTSLALGLERFPGVLEDVEALLADTRGFLEQAVKFMDEDARGLTDQATRTMAQFEETAERSEATLDEIDALLVDSRAALAAADVEGLREDSQQVIERLNELMERLNREGGVLEDVEAITGNLRGIDYQATTSEVSEVVRAIGAAARRADHVLAEAEGLSTTLDEAERTLRSLRRLTDALERDSDMLLHGRGERE